MSAFAKTATLLALYVTALGCSSEPPQVFTYPGLGGESALAMLRSATGTQYFALPAEGSQITISLTDEAVQLLGFADDLDTIGLSEGEIEPSTQAFSAPLPAPNEVFGFDPTNPGWQAGGDPWQEAKDFRLVPPNLCPVFEQPQLEDVDVPVPLHDSLLRADGGVYLVASSTLAGGMGAVHFKEPGQPLVTLEQSQHQRRFIVQSGDTVWVGGQRLWRAAADGPWNATVVADETDLNDETIIGLAGPVQLGSQTYEVVALTIEGTLWGWSNNRQVSLATGYPSLRAGRLLVAEDALYFTHFAVGTRVRPDNFLVRLNSDGIQSRVVPIEITDGSFVASPIRELVMADGRFFIGAATLGELISFEEDIFRGWSEQLSTSLKAVAAHNKNLFMSDSRRNLLSARPINGVYLECSDPIGRSSADGGFTFSSIYASDERLVWVSQARLDSRDYITRILRFSELTQTR